jgi:hypothetical protein
MILTKNVWMTIFPCRLLTWNVWMFDQLGGLTSFLHLFSLFSAFFWDFRCQRWKYGQKKSMRYNFPWYLAKKMNKNHFMGLGVGHLHPRPPIIPDSPSPKPAPWWKGYSWNVYEWTWKMYEFWQNPGFFVADIYRGLPGSSLPLISSHSMAFHFSFYIHIDLVLYCSHSYYFSRPIDHIYMYILTLYGLFPLVPACLWSSDFLNAIHMHL